MYYIAYIIIGIGLGGILFLLIRKLPQFFSENEAEFDTLLQKEENENDGLGLAEKFKLHKIKKKLKNIPFGDYKDRLLSSLKNVGAKFASGFKKGKRKFKELFKQSSAWVVGLAERIDLKIKTRKKEKSDESRELKKRADKKPEKRAEFEEQEEFFSELLGSREGEKQPEKSETQKEVPKNTEPKEDSEKKEASQKQDKEETEVLSKTEKEIQQWIEKLKEEPRNGEAYMELGFIYFDQGQKDKAKSCFNSAKKLGVENERLNNLLAKLED